MIRFLVLTVLVLTNCSVDHSIHYDLIIWRVNLIDGNGGEMQREVNVYLNDGRIAAIDSKAVQAGSNVIDGQGKYLIPGLFDCHVHTSDYNKDFPRYIHYGITSVFITGGSRCTNEYYAQMRAIGEQDSFPAPRVFHTSQHFTMEGRHPVKTYRSPLWIEGESVFFLRDTLQIEELVAQVTQQPILGIKLTIEDGPHPPWVDRMPQEFINKVQKESAKRGIEVFAHVSDNLELEMAMDAGIQNLVHFTGVDLDFERDSLLIEKIYQVNPSWVTTLMIDKGFLYPLFPQWVQALREENIFEESVLNRANDSSFIYRARDYSNFLKDYLKVEELTLEDVVGFQVSDIRILYSNGINMVLGTDTGPFVLPGYSLHEEMQLLELGGMAPVDIITMGTRNAAIMMHALDSLGTLEVGKIADMILLDKNPLESIDHTRSIQEVFKAGRSQKRFR